MKVKLNWLESLFWHVHERKLLGSLVRKCRDYNYTQIKMSHFMYRNTTMQPVFLAFEKWK